MSGPASPYNSTNPITSILSMKNEHIYASKDLNFLSMDYLFVLALIFQHSDYYFILF